MLLVPLFWGSAFGATKHVLAEVPPLTVSAFRFLVAGVLMAGWTLWRKEWDWDPVRRNWPGLLLLGIVGIMGYNALFAIGMQYTTAINGALVIVINPVTTSMVAVLFLGERWSARLGLGVLLSLAGVLTVITRGDWTVLQTLTPDRGEIWLLAAVAAWTTYTSIAKIVMRNVPATMATTVSMLAGALMLWAVSLSESGWSKLPGVSLQVGIELVYLAIFPSFVAFLLFNMGIRAIGAIKASAYINLMPVNAVLIAALLYGETVTPAHGVGMVLVMSGVFLTTRAPGGKI